MLNDAEKDVFTYRGIYNLGEWVYAWEVDWNGKHFEGTSGSVKGAMRAAKRAVKNSCKMQKFLDRACK